mmetsp:Transcript_5898/g.16520  ORF Transcript_5898/g.16520 Transcript_5898/m.16520 type:complete len:414 (-) Transcript_5898:1008-2249(-)
MVAPVSSVLERPDLLVGILSHLNLSDVRRAGSVCKAWHRALDGPHVWMSLSTRNLQWEHEEANCESGTPPSEIEQYLGCNSNSYSWIPTRQLNHLKWGTDVSLATMVRQQQEACLVSATRNSRRMDAEPAARFMQGSELRSHIQNVDTLLDEWTADLRSHISNNVSEVCVGESHMRTVEQHETAMDGIEGSSVHVSYAQGSEHDANYIAEAQEQLLQPKQCGICDDTSTDSEFSSPREVFKMNFACDKGMALVDTNDSIASPPPLKRKSPARQALALSRARARATCCRVLDFAGPADSKAQRERPVAIAGHCRVESNCQEPQQSRNNATRHLHPTEDMSSGLSGQCPTDELRQLAHFGARHTVTKFVDLLGIFVPRPTDNPDVRVDSFIQKVICQVLVSEHAGIPAAAAALGS